MHLGETKDIKIPAFSDPDNFHAVTVSLSDTVGTAITAMTPSVDAATPPTYFRINPTDFGMVGTHTLTITLDDGNMQTPKPMSVTVLNDAPKFSITSIPK